MSGSRKELGMRRPIIIAALVLVVGLIFCAPEMGFTADLVKVKTCWMPEHELFFGWYAKQKGWDKEEGLDMELVYFESGMQQMEALPAKQWVLGATGGVPNVMGALRYGVQTIGIGNDESFLNAVYVRPNSPVAKAKGAVSGFPKVYGKAELIKGKTVLVTTVSSAHYALSSYLKVFGLKDKDVVIKQMDQASIMAAFESGIGDFACLWAPYTYKAAQNGWIEAGNVNTCGAAIPITFVGDKEFCDKNPEVVAKFLRVMFRGINKLADEGATPENIALFQKMYKEFAGMEYSAEDAKKDIEGHPVFKYEQQVKLMDASKGQSEAQRWEGLLAAFLHDNGRMNDAEYAKVKDAKWVTDKYLKMVKTPIPPYK
ncbi:MAG TPA: ABC transporter substrate-binding protein [Syntrophobacteria bacterium]|nr:ABC transporter substrate-binding protein [Syntrophobacteria bacterium]